MMCVDEGVILKNGITIGEILFMYSLYYRIDSEEARNSLIKKGLITATYDEDYNVTGLRVTNKGIALMNNIVIDSGPNDGENRLTFLATKLKEIFPKGRKSGTSHYWSEGIPLIERRLKTFFKKYGDKFTDEQILNAAKEYVEGFNGDYRFMRVLKYFIFKIVRDGEGDTEVESQLLSYIENAGEVQEMQANWTSEVI